MSQDHPHTSHRGYHTPYTLWYTGSQRDRFGADKRQDIRTTMLDNNDHEDYPENFTGEWEDFPRVSRLRENLTALSQHYNLYFVAYRGWIYVHVPNRGAQAILDSPLVILDPEDSKTPMAAYTMGHVNRRCPHAVNHMVVGDLGEKEILLIARDNGDVVAWYTAAIARAVEQRLSLERHPRPEMRRSDEDLRPPSPRHFFADNVGVSAWGLAVHKKSRLIAVSANTQEVTVFAFALDGTDADAQFETTPSRPASQTAKEQQPAATAGAAAITPQAVSQVEFRRWARTALLEGKVPSRGKQTRLFSRAHESIRSLERRFRTRRRMWRIVIPMGVEASNFPSVSFCEDEEGNADRVVALDINGCMFIADIWTVTSRHIRIPPHNVQHPNGTRYDANVRGWTVLPITDAQLLPTRSLRAAIGLRPKDAVYRGKFPNRGSWIDISKTMAEVQGDAAAVQHKMRIARYRMEDNSTEHDGSRPESLAPASRLQMSDKVHAPVFSHAEDGGNGPLLAMIMVPPTGDHYTEFKDPRRLAEFAGTRGATVRMLNLPQALTPSEFRDKNPAADLVRGVSFLRANEDDVEMFTLDEPAHDVGLVCHHVLTNANPNNQVGPWDVQFGKRCSMLLTIPELNLVVLGSMCGRVALLTLTKPPQDKDDAGSTGLPRHPRRAFRVDAVLPFKSEEATRQRPYVCLLGIAVSPIPEAETSGLELRRRRPTTYGSRRKSGASKVPELEPDPPRRWRLILNYMDHTILQYEIGRKVNSDAMEGLTPWEERARRRELDDLGVMPMDVDDAECDVVDKEAGGSSWEVPFDAGALSSHEQSDTFLLSEDELEETI